MSWNELYVALSRAKSIDQIHMNDTQKIFEKCKFTKIPYKMRLSKQHEKNEEKASSEPEQKKVEKSQKKKDYEEQRFEKKQKEM